MKVLQEIQVFQLLGAISLQSPFGERDHAMIRLALQSGLRVGELAGLLVQHVAVGGGPREALDLPAGLCKGRSSRVVPLSPGARRAVAELLAFYRKRGLSVEPGAPLLQNRFGRPLGVRAVQRLVVGYRQKAQLDVRVTPHVLRHTFATGFLKQSKDIVALQAAMGWRRLDTALIYVHPSEAELAEGFQNLPDPV